MRRCDRCGKEARSLAPVLARAPGGFLPDPELVLSRQAMSPESDAALAHGDHPDDGRYQSWCPDCVRQI